MDNLEIKAATYEEIKSAYKMFGRKPAQGNIHYIMSRVAEPEENSIQGVCSIIKCPFKTMTTSFFGSLPSDSDLFYQISAIQTTNPTILPLFLKECIDLTRSKIHITALIAYVEEDEKVFLDNGFEFIGESARKRDFWHQKSDGSWVKTQHRGSIKGLNGEWRNRPIRRRYLKTFDTQIVMPKVKMVVQPAPIEKKPVKTPFPVIKISKKELFQSKTDDIMKTYRDLSMKRGLLYHNSLRIGIKTWRDKDFFYLQNYNLEIKPLVKIKVEITND
jgi:hypothetical protein